MGLIRKILPSREKIIFWVFSAAVIYLAHLVTESKWLQAGIILAATAVWIAISLLLTELAIRRRGRRDLFEQRQPRTRGLFRRGR